MPKLSAGALRSHRPAGNVSHLPAAKCSIHPRRCRHADRTPRAGRSLGCCRAGRHGVASGAASGAAPDAASGAGLTRHPEQGRTRRLQPVRRLRCTRTFVFSQPKPGSPRAWRCARSIRSSRVRPTRCPAGSGRPTCGRVQAAGLGGSGRTVAIIDAQDHRTPIRPRHLPLDLWAAECSTPTGASRR